MMHPGKDYNCRCYEERLPINAEIIEKKNQMSKDNTTQENDARDYYKPVEYISTVYIAPKKELISAIQRTNC